MKIISRGSFVAGLLLAAVVVTGCSATETKPAETTDNQEETTQVESEPAIIVNGDTINSHFQTDAVCIVDSRFERGHTLVFRANVVNAETKELVEDAKVKVVLGNGDEYEMKLGEHGQEATKLWTVAWTIPDDFPTGTLDYKYIAEVNGKEYTYEPFNVSLSKLTILEKGAEAQIAAEAKAAAEEAAKEAEEGSDGAAEGEGDA